MARIKSARGKLSLTIKPMNKERYLFLDFDGVLNTMEYQTALQWKGEPRKDEYGSLFDPEAEPDYPKHQCQNSDFIFLAT